MVAQRLIQITLPAAPPDQLWQRVEAAWSAVPPKHILSLFESMPRIRAYYEQMLEFERGRNIGLKEAGCANRRIVHYMGRSDAAIRRCWQEWAKKGRFQHHDGSGRPRTTADREGRLVVR
ncbi:HTH_Tnp_Tc3_2 domain-containing protein [Trichonephila clavipes]|uniref:HTH_Tnp_Tc3_2 domain-containing protein n=1 Tax=Trichonephila clavipes TaxID=2585209 RepID=A0A8X6R7U9_TRICX|nr:HTH_Tnp_Tc3_2 domain-containing protein [Trichonephila clavipes]